MSCDRGLFPRLSSAHRETKECIKCEEYRKKIHELEHRIQALEKNTIVPELPILDLSAEQIQEYVDDRYEEDYFMMGQKGMALFAYYFILRDLGGKLAYQLINRSRKIFQFRGLDNVVVKDPGCNKLFEAIYIPLRKKASKIYLKRIDESERNEEEHNDNDDDEEMDSDTEELIVDTIVPAEEKEEKKEKEKDYDPDQQEADALDAMMMALKDIKKASSNKRVFVNELLHLIESKKEVPASVLST